MEDALVFVDNALYLMSEALSGADVSTIASETSSAMAALSVIQDETSTSDKINFIAVLCREVFFSSLFCLIFHNFFSRRMLYCTFFQWRDRCLIHIFGIYYMFLTPLSAILYSLP